MDGWIHKTAVFSEQMHQHRRQQEEENIAELHNHNGRKIKLQFSLFELNAYTVNTKNRNNNSIINNNWCMILYNLIGVLKVSKQGYTKPAVSFVPPPQLSHTQL